MKQQWLLLLATVGMIVGVIADGCEDCTSCFVYYSGSENIELSSDSVSDMETYSDNNPGATIGYCTEANLNNACTDLSDYPEDDTSYQPCGTKYKVNNASICFDGGSCKNCKDCIQAKAGQKGES